MVINALLLPCPMILTPLFGPKRLVPRVVSRPRAGTVAARGVSWRKLGLDDLRLSERARNVLARAGVLNLADLAASDCAGLLRLKNCGRITLEELREVVRQGPLPLSPAQRRRRADHPLTHLACAWDLTVIGRPPAPAEIRALARTRIPWRRLSDRARHAVDVTGVRTGLDLAVLRKLSVLCVPNCGKRTQRELEELIGGMLNAYRPGKPGPDRGGRT